MARKSRFWTTFARDSMGNMNTNCTIWRYIFGAGLCEGFESTPAQSAGVVAFITTHAYLSGPGFSGMRRYIRQQADFGWIIDLSTEGHWASTATRVFPGVSSPGSYRRLRAPISTAL